MRPAAIIAPLSAPADEPATSAIGNPASRRAAATPASHAPLAPPPDRTSAIGASGGGAALDPAHRAGSAAFVAGARILVTSAMSTSGIMYRIGLCLQLLTFRPPWRPAHARASGNPISEGDDDQRSDRVLRRGQRVGPHSR